MTGEQQIEMVVMGRIVAPYGILGWVKIQPHTEYLDSLLDYPIWHVARSDKATAWTTFKLESGKPHGNTLVAKLAGVNDRDAAFTLKGQWIAVPRDALPPPDDDEYYWSDLIGLQVINQQEQLLGTIADIFETGANDVMVVQGERERLLPFIADVVLNVDIKNRIVQVDWDADF